MPTEAREMRLRYPVLVTDVDGTMLTSLGRLPRSSVAAAGEYIEAGGRIILATGKMYAAVQAIVSRLGLEGPHIVCDGGAVFDPHEQAFLRRAPIPARMTLALGSVLTELGIEHVYYTCDRIVAYARSVRKSHLMMLTSIGEPPPTILPEPDSSRGSDLEATKILAFVERTDDEAIRNSVRWHWRTVRITRTGPAFLEFSSPSSGKLRAVKYLGGRLGFALSQVAAIGDNDNDADLLSSSGFGAAVGSASALAISSARAVLPTNDRGGFAAFVKVILGCLR